jgi:hypothetical protein
MKTWKQSKVIGVVAILAITVALSSCGDDVIKDGTFGDFDYGMEGFSDMAIYKYNGSGGDVTIPTEIRGKSVTIIGERAFENTQLTSVIIPNSVTTIRYTAFALNQLSNIIIPNSVTEIYMGAFSSNKLTSVTIPNRVTNIGDGAFTSNPLTSITIGANVTLSGSPFDGNFETAYENTGNAAGIYTRSNTSSNTWTKQ